ncbi:MAG: hypothetical protein PVG93_04965, partial [Phycisphaerales bacterium]
MPKRNTASGGSDNKNTTTAKQLVEKTKDLAHKIAEAKSKSKQPDKESETPKISIRETTRASKGRIAGAADRIRALVGSAITETKQSNEGQMQLMQEFNTQFEHLQDDAPACDICGSITVRNGTCYKCFNCG